MSKATSTNTSNKAQAVTQLLQSKGVEVQAKVEYETGLALDNYNVALKKLRTHVFQDFSHIKRQIGKAKKDAQKLYQPDIDALQVILSDDSRKNIKEVQFSITTSADFPLRTRHYIPKITNIKVDTSAAYNLFNLCAFQEVSKGMDDKTKSMLARPHLKILAEKEIKDLDQHKVNFVCQYLAKKVSSHYMTMVIFAKIINKPPTSLTKFWLKITKKPINKPSSKIYAYKNAQYFCTICKKYVCNLHYDEPIEDPFVPPPSDPDYEYLPYTTRYLVAYAKDYKEEEEKSIGRKKKKDDDFVENYHLLYKCPQSSRYNCCLNKSRPQNERDNFNLGKFQEYEKEYILNYCLKYGFTNPCVIRLLLSNNKKCWEIEAFIETYPFHPRNISPGDIILKARVAQRNENKIKKKKTNEPVSQVWKHYVPCYHPGEPCSEKCSCRDIGNCETFCGCTKDCPLRFIGCNCKPGKCTDIGNCNCLRNNRECDPELCKSCSCDINFRLAKKNNTKVSVCPNSAILYKYRPRLLLAKSSICDGMGIFSGHNFERGDFIGEYVGELIDYVEGDYRGVIYNDLGCSYMFDYEEEMVSIW